MTQYFVIRYTTDPLNISSIGRCSTKAKAHYEVDRLRRYNSDYDFNYKYLVAELDIMLDGSFNQWTPVKKAILEKYFSGGNHGS